MSLRKSIPRSMLTAGFLLACSTAFGQTAQITGRIADSSAAVVAGAEISARNVDTGVSRGTTSNEVGNYALPYLQPGRYEVSVRKSGFKVITRSGILLQVDQQARLDFVLELGELTQNVQVTAQASMVATESGTLKQVIDEKRMSELPLNGRDPSQLIYLSAGVVQATNLSTRNGPVFNGARTTSNGVRLDGANNNDNYYGLATALPNPDALEEFSLQTNNFSAEYANSLGGVVNLRTKSGTNSLHGSVFEFVRNGAFNARNFFAATADNLKRNQYGTAVGGPIVRNKIFFFGSYQGTRLRSSNLGQSQFVFTQAMRTGDFSGVSGSLIDPLTNNPFPNRIIPQSRMDPAAVKLLNYMPTTSDPTGKLVYSTPTISNVGEYLGKIDEVFGKSIMYQRFYDNDTNAPAYWLNPQILTYGVSRGGFTRVQTVGLGYMYTFSPSLVNNLTFSYSHTNNYDYPTPSIPTLGSLGINVAQPQVPAITISMTGYASFSVTWMYDISRSTYEVSDTLTWIRGRHMLLFGGTLGRLKQDIANDFQKTPNISFSNDISGISAANYLLGQVSSFTQGGGEYKALRGWRPSGFAQDNFRVSSSLMFNFGVRLEPWLPYTDQLGRVACYVSGKQSQRFVNAPLGALYAGDSGCPDGGTQQSIANFAPRFGFAWSPGGKGRWSVRGGAGIFWEQPETILYNRFVDLAPFSPAFLRNAVQLSNPYLGSTNPFPTDFAPRTPPSNEQFIKPVQLTSFAPHFVTSYNESWNVTLERQLASDIVARVAYVGTKGTHLRAEIDQNPALYVAGATIANTQSRRINPDFSTIVETFSPGTSSFNSLQISMEKRFARNFSIISSYTWSKSIDLNSNNTEQGSGNIPNPFNWSANRGISDFNVPHRFVFSWVHSLPALSKIPAPLRFFLGGWQDSGIWTWQNAFPFSIGSGVDNSRSGIGQDRADYTGAASPMLSGGRSLQDVLHQYFNTSVFVPNALGTFGNSGRNILRGLRLFNVDLAIAKYFPVTERVRIQFRAEFFNTSNTPFFGNPGTTVGTPSFGQILSAGSPRIMQFGLKVLF